MKGGFLKLVNCKTKNKSPAKYYLGEMLEYIFILMHF